MVGIVQSRIVEDELEMLEKRPLDRAVPVAGIDQGDALLGRFLIAR